MSKLLFSLLMCTTLTAYAEPTVIYDSGRTMPIAHYLEALNMPDEPSIPLKKPAFENIQTPEMTLGRVQASKINIPMLMSPLFLIGTDNYSKQWLSSNKAALIKMSAVGMIVNTSSEQDTVDILRLANGLTVSTASASTLARRFKLSHYPVLITKSSVSQSTTPP